LFQAEHAIITTFYLNTFESKHAAPAVPYSIGKRKTNPSSSPSTNLSTIDSNPAAPCLFWKNKTKNDQQIIEKDPPKNQNMFFIMCFFYN